MTKANKVGKSKPVFKKKKVVPITENKLVIWILLGVVMVFAAVVRIRLLSIPLERDEGEYAYIGQLILQGIPPYQIAYNMKFPGTYFMYALIMSVFGQTTEGIHTGLLLANLSTILLIFLFTRKLLSNYAAIIASSAFALIAVSSSVLGIAGHATHFVILPTIAGLLLLYKGIEEDNSGYIFLSGLLLGFAPLMKQPGIFFTLFGGMYLVLSFLLYNGGSVKKNAGKLLIFCVGGILPFTLMIVLLKGLGVFDKFWFWTIQYAADYVNQNQLKDAYSLFKQQFYIASNGFHFIWALAVLGIIPLVIQLKIRKGPSLFILLFLLFSFLSICPGYYFREHYFITLLPAISISYSFLLNYLLKISIQKKELNILKYISYGLFIIPMIIGLIYQKDNFFLLDPHQVSKKMYGTNPFSESVEIANYIKVNSNKDDKIAVLGSEPQLFFYSDRHSATGYIYTYGLMEKHKNSLKMQKEMIKEIETEQPKFLIFVNLTSSWQTRPDSEMYIFDWLQNFVQNGQYKLKGIVDLSVEPTIYKWNSEALNYQTNPENFITIYEREKQRI